MYYYIIFYYILIKVSPYGSIKIIQYKSVQVLKITYIYKYYKTWLLPSKYTILLLHILIQAKQLCCIFQDPYQNHIIAKRGLPA